MISKDSIKDSDAKVKWDCFACGKYLGTQGSGGSFTLNFGYGSGLDEVKGINGWICDECVVQKHARLRVSTLIEGSRGTYWQEDCQVHLAEHGETCNIVSGLDFYGRKNVPWTYSESDRGHVDLSGFRLYYSITSEERGRIEASLLGEGHVDADLVAKLLQAIMESETRRAESEAQRWEAETLAVCRARQQAGRLSAEELAKLRAREAMNRCTPEDMQRVWEHAEWNENRFRMQEEEIEMLRERLKELEGKR